jgi:hypothetical protein
MSVLGTVNEGTSARYTGTLRDESGAVVPASSLDSLTLTLFDVATETIINARDDQDVLNAHGVTISEAGEIVWTIEPDDNVIVTVRRTLEKHEARFSATWGSTKRSEHVLQYYVRNLKRLT